MKTIKIQGNDLYYTFTQHENEGKIFYNFYENGKLINKAVDTMGDIELNGKSMAYDEFEEMYLFLRAIIKTDSNLMGDYIAITETKLFDL
jgi:hypothetical protein